jgi:hypothetical protein
MDLPAIRRTGDSESGAPPETSPVPPAPAARAERAAAQARYDIFVSAGETGVNPRCANGEDPNYDFDQCGTVRIHSPVLFSRQDGEVQEIEPSDVHQYRVGDCCFMAALLAASRSPEGRGLIHNAIRENRNDQGEVVSYTVTLHRPQTHFFGLGRTTFSDVQVTVDWLYPKGHAIPRESGNAFEVWPLVMEKAYAQFCGGYDVATRGGYPSDAMELLTGRPATCTEFGRFTGYRQDELERDLAAGKMVVLSSRGDVAGYGLIGHHSYVVTGTVVRDGKLYVELGNPWGEEQPDPVPVGELKQWFHAVSVGSVR